MNKNISTVLFIGGIVLIVLGIVAMDSFSSDLSRFFTGAPTDKSVWMFIGGLVAVVLATSGTLFSSKQVK